MGFQVINPDIGFAPDERQGLGRAHAHQQRPDQTWPRSRRHRIKFPAINSGLRQGLGHGRVEPGDMRSAGNLGNDASVASVKLDLAGHHRGMHHITTVGIPANHCRCCFVTGGFNGENEHGQSSQNVGVGSAASIRANRCAKSA